MAPPTLRAMDPVLVIRRGGLGDTLLLLPMLRALRRRWPGAPLHVAGVCEFVDVFVAYGAADVARSSEDLALWALGLDGSRGDAARRALRGCAAVYSDGPLPGLPAGGPRVVAFDPRAIVPGVPFGLQLARQVGLPVEWPGDARLAARPAVAAGAPLWLSPGSGGKAKCWPRERWLALARELSALALPLRVVVGPTEAETDDPRRWPWPVGTTFFADGAVVELAAQLAGARAYVGNDSGPSHLAAMLGVPTVALFGPSDPAVWAPVGGHVQVLAGGADWASLPVGRALDAVVRAASA